MSELRYHFEVFEGPLDLLLHLVRKEEVDIYEVDMVRLADQFCEYIDLMKQFDLNLAGEFIVMASTLMYIKSKELLPVDQQVLSEEDEAEDPRWDLIRQLVEYRKFKDAADDFPCFSSPLFFGFLEPLEHLVHGSDEVENGRLPYQLWR